MKRALLIISLILTAALCWAASPYREVLDNGLTLVVEEDHSAPVVTVQFFVGTGSMFEDNYLGTGISHLIEHTLSEGTPRLSSADIERIRAELGNNSNAYTSNDTVSYYVVTAPEQTLKAVDLLSDYVFNPTFPQEAVDTQKGIILREMARGEDDPGHQLYYLFAETMFRQSPMGVKVIGYPEQFAELTRADLVAHHRRFYVPGNVVAVVVGDINAQATLADLRTALGKVPRRALRQVILPQEPPQLSPRRAVKQQEALSRAYFMLGYPTVSLFSDDMYPLDIAAYILSNGTTSRLVSKLRDEKGLVDGISAYSSTPPYEGGVFGVSATASPENVDAAEKAILAELAALQQRPVTCEELERAKRQKEADLLFGRVTTQGRAGMYGNDLLTTGDLNFSERYVARIRQVTAAQVQQAARKYFVPQHYNFAALLPATTNAEAAPAEAPAAKPAGTVPAAAKPAAAGTVSPARAAVVATTAPAQVQEVTLANGMRLLVQENHAVPVVNLFIAAPGGLRFENEKNVGITSLMANMLTRGTKTRNRLQIAAALENVGGGLGPYSGRNSFGVSAQVRAQDLPLALEIAADVLGNPTFPEAELQQQKQLHLAALATRKDDVDTVANDLMLQTLFRQYPYRYPTAGTPESVAALTREDLIAFHKRAVEPASMVMAIFGDTMLAQARVLAERYFANFKAGRSDLQPAPIEAPPTEPRTENVTRPQQQAVIVYGFRSGTIADPERYARDVMSAVFAGIGYPGGRLHNALRGQQLVYATFAHEMPGPDAGVFTIYAGTAPDRAGVVQQQIERLVTELQAAPPTAEELALGKNIAIASHAVELESSGARAQAVALNVLYGLGRNEIFEYADRINAVTADEVQQQARQLMPLAKRVLVVTHP
ncbi:MAG: pitrilysin family protein [Armatimonadia bacterium]